MNFSALRSQLGNSWYLQRRCGGSGERLEGKAWCLWGGTGAWFFSSGPKLPLRKGIRIVYEVFLGWGSGCAWHLPSFVASIARCDLRFRFGFESCDANGTPAVPLGHKHRVTLGKSRSPFALRADFGEGDGDEAVCHWDNLNKKNMTERGEAIQWMKGL